METRVFHNNLSKRRRPLWLEKTDDPWAAIDRLTEGIDDALLRAEPARYGRALPVHRPRSGTPVPVHFVVCDVA
jgi:hypothetical protein